MRNRSWRRQFFVAIVISSGITSSHALAYDGEQAVEAAEPVVVEDAPLEDPIHAEQAVEGEEPVPMEMAAEAYAPMPCSCCNSTCCTKKKKEAATEKMKGAFKGLFYDNDFSYLNDPCYDGPVFIGDCLKGLCCGKLDIGGEIRMRYHKEENHRGLGITGRDDNFWLTRYRMFANYRMNKYFRFYGEYIYAESGGETFTPRPIEVNRSDMQNLFVDAKLTQGLTLRVGRQELLYGSQRLISPLDWANTRRTFDGVKGMYKGTNWNLDGFYVNPLDRDFDGFDEANEDIKFFGVYGTRKNLSIGTMDLYYLGLDNTSGANDFSYHTIGTRVAGSTDRGLLYELEGGVQFGENNPGFGDHSAGFFTGGLGRKLKICTHCGEWNPTFWAWYDWASGGDDIPANRGDDGFDHLFPLAHKYNGFMDLFGRRNLHDVNMQFITPILGPKVKMLIWYHYFFLDEKTTPYSVVMTPFNPDNRAGSRDLGHEIDVLFSITLNPRHSALVGYSYFNAGDYYSTTPGIPNASPPREDNDAQFFYMQYQMRF